MVRNLPQYLTKEVWPGSGEQIRSSSMRFATGESYLARGGRPPRWSVPNRRIVGRRRYLSEYIRALQVDYRAATVYHRVVGFKTVLVIAPNMDRRFIRLAIRRLPKGIDPSRKRARIRETAALVDLGISLMRRADECETRYIRNIAVNFAMASRSRSSHFGLFDQEFHNDGSGLPPGQERKSVVAPFYG